METKEPQNPQVQESTDIVSKFKANKKKFTVVAVALVACLVVASIWIFVSQQGSKAADEAVALADIEQNDSIAVELYKVAAEKGYKSGNRAKVMVAISLYKDGKYQEALEYLEDADIDDSIIKAGVYSLTGDCYTNLKNYDDALDAYDDAISAADENPNIVPVVLFKKANIYRNNQDFAAEYEALKEIIEDYPNFNTQLDIRKYYERAKAAAGK